MSSYTVMGVEYDSATGRPIINENYTVSGVEYDWRTGKAIPKPAYSPAPKPPAASYSKAPAATSKPGGPASGFLPKPSASSSSSVSNVGRLIQAYITINWAGVNLSAYDDGNGDLQILAQKVEISIPEEGSAPSLDFNITPNPIGFEVFNNLKSNSIDQPINVTLGFPNGGTTSTFSFRFVGFDYTTGADPEIAVRGVSVLKGGFTENRISYTMEEPITLNELPEFLKKQAGKGGEAIKFQWLGKAQSEAANYEYQENIIERTPYSILNAAMRAAGVKVESGDTAVDGTIVLAYDPSLQGEAQQQAPKVVTSGGAQATAAQKNVWIIGPGLMTSVARKQTFGAGQSDPTGGASRNNPKSFEQEQKEVAGESSGDRQISSAADAEYQRQGLTGTAMAPSQMSRTPETKKKPAKDARAAVSAMIQTTIDFTVPLVPYLIGVKASDFCVIPSLKGPGAYIEDWVIKEAKYSQTEDGNVEVTITGARPFSGQEPFLDGGTLSSVKGAVSSLTSPAAWAKFYWIEGNIQDQLKLSS